MLVHRTKKLLVRSTSVIFLLANRVDPDQTALTRVACSGSALFAKALKGVYLWDKGLKQFCVLSTT